MTDVATSAPASAGEYRVVSLSALSLRQGFNPRTTRDPERFAQTVRSVRESGVLHPILVTPDSSDDTYVVVAGEGRYLAATEAGLLQVPVIVGEVDERTRGLELAMAENLAREDLDIVAEARGFAGLKQAGWSKKGIAEFFGVSQKRVTERLQILELPDELHPLIASGEIPPSAVRALVTLAKIHRGLPQIVTARVAGTPAQPWAEPLTWQEVVADPVGALTADYEGEDVCLPDDVYDAGDSYPIPRFTLSEKATKDLQALCKLLGVEPEQITVRFGREAIEQALALNAAHPTQDGWHHIIVGQDVADQLAGDCVAAALKQARADARHSKERARSGMPEGSEPTGQQGDAMPSEEAMLEQRRAERVEREERQRAAVAHNAELGAAVFKHLARLKVDERVLKVLISVDALDDLADLAARGARYGLPGWVQETSQANGKVKATVLQTAECREKARDFLGGAASMAEIAGRVFALVAMARYADEDAVARTKQSMTSLRVGKDAPWSDEVLDLIDEICAERLPDHLTADIREKRAAAKRADERARVERNEALKRLDGLADRVSEMDADARAQAIADAETAYGRYSPEAWDVQRLVNEATSADETALQRDDPEPVDKQAA
jgi:ParB/RepB/Spo0J family partition protein